MEIRKKQDSERCITSSRVKKKKVRLKKETKAAIAITKKEMQNARLYN